MEELDVGRKLVEFRPSRRFAAERTAADKTPEEKGGGGEAKISAPSLTHYMAGEAALFPRCARVSPSTLIRTIRFALIIAKLAIMSLF